MKQTDAEWRKSSPDANAYGRPQQESDEELLQVGPGTPMGDVLRRYWHPIYVSEKLEGLPREVRILGEDLVLFRDGEGRPGLLYPRCMHRGTTLNYGKVEDKGIRCCYHGWLFDVEGNCLDQPCEPEGGKHLERSRQPWYPVKERYGLIFTYMGPPEKMPVLPRYDNLENIEDDEELQSYVGMAGTLDRASEDPTPCSWMHMNDNVMDPFHVWVLHGTMSGAQFDERFKLAPEPAEYFYSDHGVCYSIVRNLGDGQEVDRISSWLMPNIMSVPDTQLKSGQSMGIGWSLPVDDTHFLTVQVRKAKRGQVRKRLPLFEDKVWSEMTEEEHQRAPTDYEAQVGMGPMTLSSEEHIVTSDRGIMMQRRVLRQQIKAIEDGGDPAGVEFDEAKALVKIRSGNFFRKSEAAE